MGKQHVWGRLIYMEWFDSSTRTLLDSKLSCIASTCKMAAPRRFVEPRDAKALSMTGQKHADRHVRVEKYRHYSIISPKYEQSNSPLQKFLQI